MDAACGALRKIAHTVDATLSTAGMSKDAGKLIQTTYLTKNTTNNTKHPRSNTGTLGAGISKSALGLGPQVPQMPAMGASMQAPPEAQTAAPAIDPQYQDNMEAELRGMSKKTALPPAMPLGQGVLPVPGQGQMMGNSAPGNNLAQSTMGLGPTIGTGPLGLGPGGQKDMMGGTGGERMLT
jgi:hypothetical protein